RILFTGGGTAGHVIVNLALIPHFQKEGWAVDYIGSKDGIERDLIQKIPGIAYYPISTGKLRRYMSLENFKDLFRVAKGTVEQWQVIQKTDPSVIISKCAFDPVPHVASARMRRVPTIVHEYYLTPGLANKIPTPYVKKVLTTFPETLKYLQAKKAAH